jgi:hypothetical protein
LSIFNRADIVTIGIGSPDPPTSLIAFVRKVWFADAKRGFMHRLDPIDQLGPTLGNEAPPPPKRPDRFSEQPVKPPEPLSHWF